MTSEKAEKDTHDAPRPPFWMGGDAMYTCCTAVPSPLRVMGLSLAAAAVAAAHVWRPSQGHRASGHGKPCKPHEEPAR